MKVLAIVLMAAGILWIPLSLFICLTGGACSTDPEVVKFMAWGLLPIVGGIALLFLRKRQA